MGNLTASCANVRRKVEAAREEEPSVARHLEACPACAARADELKAPGRLLARGAESAEIARMRHGLAASVTARLESGALPRSRRPAWFRPLLAGTAAALAAAVALLASLHGGPTPLAPATLTAAAAGEIAPAAGGAPDAFTIVRDGDDVSIRFAQDGGRVHRIAQSTRPDFSTVKVTKFQGDAWRDPAPAPIVGGVVYYRID